MDWNNKKIFITTGGGLGDMLCYTPALKALKKAYPKAKITFMTKYGHHEVLEGLPYIDKLTYIIRGKAFGRYRVLPDLYGEDAVVFTDWQPQLLFFAKCFGIPVRAGIERVGHKLNGYLTKPMKNLVYQSDRYAARSDADFFEQALDIQLPGEMTNLDIAKPSESVQQAVSKKLKKLGIEKDYILLSPFASQTTRDWQPKDVVAFIKKIEKRYGIPVVISASQDRKKDAMTLGKYVISDLKTMELVALIGGAKLCVTPDSGPMHVAGAMGTPCIALFSKDLPSRWAPRHNCYPIYTNEDCSPCDDATAFTCKTVNCMRKISAQMVLDAVEKIL